MIRLWLQGTIELLTLMRMDGHDLLILNLNPLFHLLASIRTYTDT